MHIVLAAACEIVDRLAVICHPGADWDQWSFCKVWTMMVWWAAGGLLLCHHPCTTTGQARGWMQVGVDPFTKGVCGWKILKISKAARNQPEYNFNKLENEHLNGGNLYHFCSSAHEMDNLAISVDRLYWVDLLTVESLSSAEFRLNRMHSSIFSQWEHHSCAFLQLFNNGNGILTRSP